MTVGRPKDLEAFLQKIEAESRIEYVPLQDEVIDKEEDETKPKAQCSRLAEEMIALVPIEKRGLALKKLTKNFMYKILRTAWIFTGGRTIPNGGTISDVGT